MFLELVQKFLICEFGNYLSTNAAWRTISINISFWSTNYSYLLKLVTPSLTALNIAVRSVSQVCN